MSSESRYRLGHHEFTLTSDGLQAILAGAYDNKARPCCLCCAEEPPMYIAKIGGEFYLKRMPETGHLHDPGCNTFDPPPEVSGLGHVNGQAIVANDAGEIFLKLDFPLTVRGGRSNGFPESDGNEVTSVVASKTKLQLLATLHYLWEAAELTKWRSKWGKRRSWFVVRRELMAVAVNTKTKAGDMTDRLFVPPMYSVENKNRIAADRKRFMHHLQPVKGKPVPLGILIAEYKGHEASQYGRKVKFKHMPDYSFFMDEQTGKRFDKLASDKVQMIEAMPNTHLMAIATFSVKANYAEIHEISVMPVNCQWIPFDSDREFELIEILIERDFIKCLKYNLPNGAPIANVVLLDVDSPTALYSPSPETSSEKEEELINLAKEGVYPFWHWPALEFEMPELPKKHV